MPRHVLACHTVQSRPDKIVVQSGGPMPECRDLQSGVIGYYEFVEVVSLKDAQRMHTQLEFVSLVLTLLVVVVIVHIFVVHRKQQKKTA